jgi:hypothetical protein
MLIKAPPPLHNDKNPERGVKQSEREKPQDNENCRNPNKASTFFPFTLAPSDKKISSTAQHNTAPSSHIFRRGCDN